MKHLKKLSEEIVHTNPWWTYKHDTYEKPRGGVGDYYYGQTGGMVLIVPVLQSRKIVLTLQYRYLNQKQSIEFPAGGIKEESDPLAAAKAELREETGCIAEEFVRIGWFEAANGIFKDGTHLFIAKVIEQHEQQLDDTEDIEVIYRRPDELDAMIVNNDIWDGQTLAAWSLVRPVFFKEQCETTSPALKGVLDNFLL